MADEYAVALIFAGCAAFFMVAGLGYFIRVGEERRGEPVDGGPILFVIALCALIALIPALIKTIAIAVAR